MALPGGLNQVPILCACVDVDFLTKGLAMQYPTIELVEDEVLAFEVSDEALENAAGNEIQAFTLGACSGLSVCPG
jgi:hypothetical protein